MASLKAVSRTVRDAAAQLAESRGMDSDALPSSETALLLLATAALKDIEKQSFSSRETAAAARSARMLLRPHLPQDAERKRSRSKMEKEEKEEGREQEPEEEEEVEKSEMDLGQYAKTDVFHGDAKKRAKFARLMGGAKIDGNQSHCHHHHNTFAADERTQRRITGELEEQYNAAIHRHGKKGLGA